VIRYVCKRILHGVGTILGVLVVTFLLFVVIGGDISEELAGPGASAKTIAEIRHEYGFDRPLLWGWDSQFVRHVKGAVTFRFGRARDRERIAAKIRRGVGPSLAVTVPILVGVVSICVGLSVVLALVRGGVWDTVGVVICTAGMSMPYLGYILLGQYFLAYKLGWFAVYYSPERGLAANVALPVLIGIAAGLGGELRFYRMMMLEQLEQEYVRAAFARGLSRSRVLFRHVLRNALVPIVTRISLALPFLFLGSVLLERFFGIPGLGSLVVEAVGRRDYFVINAMTYIGSVVFVVCQLLADICCCLLDPRVRLG